METIFLILYISELDLWNEFSHSRIPPIKRHLMGALNLMGASNATLCIYLHIHDFSNDFQHLIKMHYLIILLIFFWF